MSRAVLRRRARAGFLANERGLSLIEVMIAITIFAILSTTATFSYAIFKERARESGLKATAHNLQLELLVHINDFDLQHRWGRNYDKAYLNGYLERTWESVPYDNSLGHRNPVSRSKVVLNGISVPTWGKLTQPAIFITSNPAYALANLRSTMGSAALKGSIVVYLNNNIKDVELYYFNLAGRPSTLKVTIHPSN